MTKTIEFFRVLYNFILSAPTLIFFKPPANEEKTSLGLMFQQTAARHAKKAMTRTTRLPAKSFSNLPV